MQNLDPNDIAAKVALEAFEHSLSSAGRTFDSLYESLSIGLKAKFKKYKKRSADNYCYVRTLLHRDRPIRLQELYVETRFQHQKTTISDVALIEAFAEPCRVLIRGTAGSGKSVFLRLLNIISCEADSSLLPVFIELKQLNDENKTIDDLVVEYLVANGLNYSDNAISKIIESGSVLLILDGFDEIDHDRRPAFATEISNICKNRPNTSIVVSSRPDEIISSVERLMIYNVKPFDRAQSVSLLEKLPYDHAVKQKFLNEINDDFYRKHEQFLSNPLLITMMLMTYHQFAEIPSKVYLFYENAFATLFSWHDSSKDVFKRKSYTNIPIDEFRRIFSYFCFDSYNDQKFQFSEPDLLERIKLSIESEQIDTKPSDYLNDLLISVCLMQRDGLSIAFAHRSFQEYFAAHFISRLSDKAASIAIEAAAKRVTSDLVLPMVQAMAPNLFERSWALPVVRKLLRRTANIDPVKDPIAYFSKYFKLVYVQKKKTYLRYDENIWGRRLIAIHKSYNSKIEATSGENSDSPAEAFLDALTEDSDYRTRVENEIGHKLDLDKVYSGEYQFSLAKLPRSLTEHLALSAWAEREHKYLLALAEDISNRLNSRETSFKAAITRNGAR